MGEDVDRVREPTIASRTTQSRSGSRPGTDAENPRRLRRGHCRSEIHQRCHISGKDRGPNQLGREVRRLGRSPGTLVRDRFAYIIGR